MGQEARRRLFVGIVGAALVVIATVLREQRLPAQSDCAVKQMVYGMYPHQDCDTFGSGWTIAAWSLGGIGVLAILYAIFVMSSRKNRPTPLSP